MSHARLSASQAKRWATCPGSAAYLEKYTDMEGSSSEAGMLGTAAHALSERCLGDGLMPSDFDGRLIEITNPGEDNEGVSILHKRAKMPTDPTRVVFEVDQDMQDAVTCMVSYVHKRCVELSLVDINLELGSEQIASEVAGLVKKGVVKLEAHVVPLPERDDTGGTGDVIIDAWPDVLEVVDYKNGIWCFVPVDMNYQLRSYALGALQDESADYGLVRYTICQPRHPKSPDDGIMFEETTVDELFIWKNELAGAAQRVDHARSLVADGASLTDLFDAGFIDAGEDGEHCTFCPIVGQPCPAAKAAAEAQCVMDFEDEPIELGVPTDVNALARVLKWAPFLEKLIKGAVANAEALLFSGTDVPDKKLVYGKSNRRWHGGDEKAIVIDMVAKFGVAEEAMYSAPKLITGPQAEKLVPKDRRKAFNAEMLIKPLGRPTMVDASDKKPAIIVDAASDFENLED